MLTTAIGNYKRPMSSYRVFRPFAGNGLLLVLLVVAMRRKPKADEPAAQTPRAAAH